jgi:hypothetical protein
MRFLSVKDKLFLVLFVIGSSTIIYSVHMIIGAKFGLDTFGLVRELKITMVDFIS